MVFLAVYHLLIKKDSMKKEERRTKAARCLRALLCPVCLSVCVWSICISVCSHLSGERSSRDQHMRLDRFVIFSRVTTRPLLFAPLFFSLFLTSHSPRAVKAYMKLLLLLVRVRGLFQTVFTLQKKEFSHAIPRFL